jgi:hypothetical protein
MPVEDVKIQFALQYPRVSSVLVFDQVPAAAVQETESPTYIEHVVTAPLTAALPIQDVAVPAITPPAAHAAADFDVVVHL